MEARCFHIVRVLQYLTSPSALGQLGPLTSSPLQRKLLRSFNAHHSALQRRRDGRGPVEPDGVHEEAAAGAGDEAPGAAQGRPQPRDQTVHVGVVGIASVPAERERERRYKKAFLSSLCIFDSPVTYTASCSASIIPETCSPPMPTPLRMSAHTTTGMVLKERENIGVIEEYKVGCCSAPEGWKLAALEGEREMLSQRAN